MSNKLGEVISYGCYGGKAIMIHTSPYGGSPSIPLPEIFNDVPVGFIAYLDSKGQVRFMDEDPHDYEDRGSEE